MLCGGKIQRFFLSMVGKKKQIRKTAFLGRSAGEKKTQENQRFGAISKRPIKLFRAGFGRRNELIPTSSMIYHRRTCAKKGLKVRLGQKSGPNIQFQKYN